MPLDPISRPLTVLLRHVIIFAMTITTVAKHLVNLFYPLHCPACGIPLEATNSTGICKTCPSLIRRVPRPYCISCGRPVDHEGDECSECRKTSFHFDRAYSACIYEKTVKELVHNFKYGHAPMLDAFLSDLMINFLRDNDNVVEGVRIITFIPIDRRSLSRRGFNQARILADAIGKFFELPVINTLEKTIFTRHQNELSREERLVNLKDTFKVRGDTDLKDKILLLIDDVMTTGATLSEGARILKAAGAKEVRCFTLARGAS